MNYVDVIVIIFIGLIVFEGYRKGLVKMLFELAGMIIAFFLSKSLSFIIVDFLTEKTKFYSMVHDFFQTKAQWLTEFIQKGTTDAVVKMQEGIKLPQEMKSLLMQSFKGEVSLGNFDIFVNQLTDFAIKSLGFVITFLIVYSLLLLLVNLLDAFLKLPLLNLSNKVAGAVIGLGKSMLILYIIFALASPLIAFVADSNFVKEINKSVSSGVFYENNIILNYLSYKGFYEK